MSNAIPKDLIYFESIVDYEYIQRAKMLVVQKESSVELELEPEKYIKVGLECTEEEKELLL